MIAKGGRATAQRQTWSSSSSTHRRRKLLLHCSRRSFAVPILALAGLLRFSTSFFLARRSLPATSACDFEDGVSELLVHVLGLSPEEVNLLVDGGLLVGGRSGRTATQGQGCWVPRTVDAAVVVVVDALRFDFAAGRLPNSIGSRLRTATADQHHPHHQPASPTMTTATMTTTNSSLAASSSSSRLFHFVADPPTVTMQRLKGLTTGGLPTFADISGNFGGASVDEDSWVQQLRDVPFERRRRRRTSSNRRRDEGIGKRHLDDASVGVDGGKKRGGGGGGEGGARLAFVGDDTWIDLFPNQFDDAHPYPSFNTRDLDTVDDGCMKHLPRLLQNLEGGDDDIIDDGHDGTRFELVVAHFLGVDHVGHTYGPQDRHMTEKLGQMDDTLSYVLDRVDATPAHSCRAALVFGDHGMTQDGNHGGGTEDETNAALFVHFSKGCGSMGSIEFPTPATSTTAMSLESESAEVREAFESIHQIDLVPTISVMLGLPIPFANLGGLIPALLPSPARWRRGLGETNNDDNDSQSIGEAELLRTEAAAIALALNAAQIWKYLQTYSRTANALPAGPMLELNNILNKATDTYRSALLSRRQGMAAHGSGGGSIDGEQGSLVAYREASILYKLFLSEATELGKRVWTRFDSNGMILGGFLLGVALLASLPAWDGGVGTAMGLRANEPSSHRDVGQVVEMFISLLFMIFHCFVLTFSNSYIEAEKEIIMYLIAILCISVAIRRWLSCHSGTGSCDNSSQPLKGHGSSDAQISGSTGRNIWIPILLALCSRCNETLVRGHGLDPSIRMHAAHHSAAFLSSLSILVGIRIWLSYLPSFLNHQVGRRHFDFKGLADVICLILLAFSWWEKQSPDHTRNGYRTCRAALLLSFLGAVISIFVPSASRNRYRSPSLHVKRRGEEGKGTGKGGQDRTLSVLSSQSNLYYVISLLFNAMIFTIATMGPSAATSSILFVVQAWALYDMTVVVDRKRCSAPVLASLWRLSIRHAFFATNHAPTFSRLQYSAAFVASDTFYFHTAGLSLFVNTFGWEMMGVLLILAVASHCRRNDVWAWFCFYQLLEAAGSCMSVTLMRRHLMVWAIFAPRFVFAGVFTLICLGFSFLGLLGSDSAVHSFKNDGT